MTIETSRTAYPVKQPAAGSVQSVASMVPGPDGIAQPAAPMLSALNITTPTVVKALPGRAYRLVVVVAGSGAGTVNDCAATGDAAAANQIATAPVAVGATDLGGFPCGTGIVVVPGAGQTLALSFN